MQSASGFLSASKAGGKEPILIVSSIRKMRIFANIQLLPSL
jgi:hypothetical protein